MIDAYRSSRLYPIRKPVASFCAGAAVALLGGLIGLGGAEFRLPLLIAVFAMYPHRAVRVNLLISLSTLAFAGLSRFEFTQAGDVAPHLHVIVFMISGGAVSAWLGAGYLARIPKERVSTVIAALLLMVAALLAVETVLPLSEGAPVFSDATPQALVALAAGACVGAVSSLLGVAGGEFIIPILVLAFGMDIKSAGTASIIISTPLVVTGIVRHVLGGKFRSHTLLSRLVIPMSAGSVVGAMVGGYASQWVPADLLKAILAAILAASSVKLLLSAG